MNKDWLNALKEKDQVIVRERWRDPVLHSVSRVTEKQIILSFTRLDRLIETRYWKKNGYEVGSDLYGGTYLEEPTQENIARIAEAKLNKAAIKLRDEVGIPNGIEKLERFIALMEEAKALNKKD